MDNLATKTISKYALLLAVFYGLEFLLKYIITQYVNESSDSILNSYLVNGNMLITLLLNIVAAFIINSDKNRLDIEGKYSVLLTIFYRPIGIVLFLIFVVNKSMNERPVQDKG